MDIFSHKNSQKEGGRWEPIFKESGICQKQMSIRVVLKGCQAACFAARRAVPVIVRGRAGR